MEAVDFTGNQVSVVSEDKGNLPEVCTGLAPLEVKN